MKLTQHEIHKKMWQMYKPRVAINDFVHHPKWNKKRFHFKIAIQKYGQWCDNHFEGNWRRRSKIKIKLGVWKAAKALNKSLNNQQ